MLRAISRVETGRRLDGRLQPWPWTINVGGQGYWFKSEVEAKAYAFKIFKSGTRSFDVGCFQINYRWHGKAFRSIDAMFDPDENATYAARFLNELHAELGSWPAAAGLIIPARHPLPKLTKSGFKRCWHSSKESPEPGLRARLGIRSPEPDSP